MPEKERNERICIGIPCYASVSPETLMDYMRFTFHIGRRLPQYDIFLAIKTKSEQFRARNGIVEAALQQDCDWLLMLDDDHIIDWEDVQTPTERYDFVDKLIKHMRADPKLKIVGALYYHRGGQCSPVILKEGKDGGYYWIGDNEIEGKLQEVAVTGGGCMMIDMEIFNVIPSPWFQIENTYGTDIQICQLARDHGFKVACDTSVVVGHVLNRREIVTPKNRLRITLDTAKNVTGIRKQIDSDWISQSALQLYKADAMEYAGWKSWDEIVKLAAEYQPARKEMDSYSSLAEYYRSRGPKQLARQIFFHFKIEMVKAFEGFASLIDVGKAGYGLDFCCGSAPLGFDYVMRGQKMDFVDIDGAYAYEFTKWRAKHRGVEDQCGWKLKGPYDYILLMDALEHLGDDWREVLTDVLSRLRNGGAVLTNYFNITDIDNPEHINIRHEEARKFITEHSIYPLNLNVWIKREWGWPE